MIASIAGRRLWALAVACSLAACTKVGTTGTGGRAAYTHPHELRFAAAEDLVGLNPLTNGQATLLDLSAMTMAYLIKTDAKSEATVPEIATAIPTKANGGISADGKVITYHIRPGVKWSDGKPLDADDVVFTTKLILDPKTNVVSHEGWDQIASIGEPDKHTVVYHLKKPYGPFAYTYFSTGDANPAILPEHILEGQDVNTSAYNALPVGAGPFRYKVWKRGDSVELEQNPYYFRGAPKLTRVVYRLVQDRNTVLGLLRTHDIDLWTPVTPHFVPDVRGIAGATVLSIPSFFYDHLDFNTSRPALADPVVRRALRMVMERKLVNDKIHFGIFDLGETVMPTANSFHLDVPLVPIDVMKANAMLERAGWKRGSDGIRARNGVRLALDFATSTGTPDADQEIEIFRQDWQKLGAAITVKHYLASLLFAPASAGGIIYSGKFDAIVFAWGGNPNGGDVANLFACDRFPPNGQNDMKWCDRAVSADIARGSVEYERPARIAGMHDIQRRVFDAAPTVVLDYRKALFAYNSDLKNFRPGAVSPFDDMMQVDI